MPSRHRKIDVVNHRFWCALVSFNKSQQTNRLCLTAINFAIAEGQAFFWRACPQMKGNSQIVWRTAVFWPNKVESLILVFVLLLQKSSFCKLAEHGEFNWYVVFYKVFLPNFHLICLSTWQLALKNHQSLNKLKIHVLFAMPYGPPGWFCHQTKNASVNFDGQKVCCNSLCYWNDWCLVFTCHHHILTKEWLYLN